MIQSLTVINYLDESFKMELRRPELSGFLITDIRGIGPAKASINTTEISTGDGSSYNSARLNARNIVLQFELLPNPTVEDTRQLSYKYFPIKKKLTLVIETDNRLCEATGYVESNEPILFAKQETIQISITCPDPYFYSASEKDNNVTVFSGDEPAFEFPFSNESLSEPMIEFGIMSNDNVKSVIYNGDAEIGITLTIHAIGPASNITIYNSGTGESMSIDTKKIETLTGSGLVFGDDIIITTVKRNKSIRLLRAGKYTNILNCLNKNADWFQLAKGDNVFRYTAETGAENLQFKIENRTIFEGV